MEAPDLEKGLLHVRQAMLAAKTNEGILKKPKSRAGTRTINFLGNEASELSRYALDKEFNLRLRNNLSPNNFVFFNVVSSH